MALYEAIRKGQSKRRGREKTVRFRPFASARRGSAIKKKEVGYYQRLEAGGDAGKSKLAGLWSRRIALSLSCPVAAFLLVAAAAVLVAAVRFGQLNYDVGWLFFEPVAASEPASGQLLDIGKLIDSAAAEPVKKNPVTVTDNKVAGKDKIEDNRVIAPQGTNVIVIQAYKQRRDLEPVKQHFEKNGIETRIVEKGSFFFLKTTRLYHRCSVSRDSFNPDYDGDVAMKEIRRVGLTYKAPKGYESFRPNLFQDAYGEKVK
ncbi:MAG: hypothetical protein DRP66_04645 [Planctomycetota bacterium]|nr:MAG: hypothetical protein DRP66_04645 [Planctomycetota bacterium]